MANQTASFVGLVSKIRACTLCQSALPLEAKPIVQLNQNARILIAGQAPGIKAHNSGIPFNDASGKRLQQWLGVDQATFYNENIFAILPMGFCYPGKGESGDLPPENGVQIRGENRC